MISMPLKFAKMIGAATMTSSKEKEEIIEIAKKVQVSNAAILDIKIYIAKVKEFCKEIVECDTTSDYFKKKAQDLING